MFAWIKKVRKLDRTFCWSFIGVVIGLLGIFIGYYLYLLSYRSPCLIYEVLSSTNIVDIKEDTPKLRILYGGLPITDSGNVLKIVSVRIVNSGTDAIRKNDYMEEEPLGISVTAGEIIEAPQVTNASNDYLSKTLKPVLVSKTKARFTPVMLRAKDFVVVKLLVIHNSEQRVQIVPDGVLANVSNIMVKQLADTGPVASKEPWEPTLFAILVSVVSCIIFSTIGSFFKIWRHRTIEVVKYGRRAHETQPIPSVISEFMRNTKYRDEIITNSLLKEYARNGISGVLKWYMVIKSNINLDDSSRDLLSRLVRLGIVVLDENGRYMMSDKAALIYEEFLLYAEKRHKKSR
jgi:hypothetical protein